MPTLPPNTRRVPASALRFPATAVRFGAPGKAGDGDGPVPAPRTLSMTALSGQIVPSWYFGPCLHDLAGMKLHKPSLPVDYCHDSGEVIGFCDKFDTANGTLEVGGAIVPFTDGDRASEVVYKGDSGVPWEASISFDTSDLMIEELDAGQVATCNGQQVVGPLTIFRQWSLRGIAVCPYGLDKNTSSRFAAGDGKEFSIHVIRKETAMSAETELKPEEKVTSPATAGEQAANVEAQAAAAAAEPAKPADAGMQAAAVEVATAEPAKPAVENTRQAEGKRFLDAFGDRGGKWFAEGLSFEEAQAKFTTELQAENADLRKRIGGAQLAGVVVTGSGAVSFGEDKSLSFDPANADPDAATQLTAAQQRYGKGFGAFVASIRLPAFAAAAANNN